VRTDTLLLLFPVNPTKLNALLKKSAPLRVTLPDALAQREPVAVLIHSFLLWEAGSAQALEAFRRIQESTVDFNELRVSLPQELVAVVGPAYPRVEERLRRLRACLNEVFKREHAVRLPTPAGKRDIKVYVESLQGIVVPFVAARVLLQCFGVHGVPVDEQTRALLADQGLCQPTDDLVEVAGMLARHVKSEQAESAHEALQGLVDLRLAAQLKPAGRGATRVAAAKARAPRAATSRRPDGG